VKTTKITWLAVLALLLPSLARAEEGAESQSAGMRGVAHQRFIALLNPMGMEHSFAIGFRGALGDQEDILFMGAHAETGLVSYVSPVFASHGGYVQVAPFSFLVLRGELVHHVVWPIGMEGAGYYGLQSYQDDTRPEALTAERGESAQGWNARMSATLQGLVPLGPVRLLFQDSLTMQYGSLGEAPFQYDMKWDLVLAREDWVLINSACLLLEIDFDAHTHLRVGAYDDARYVPRSGYLGHQFGPLVMLAIDRPLGEVSSVSPFVRAGYYTDHATRRDEFTILGGVSVDYDLGGMQ
jgi:hypothetical protein